MRYKLAHCRLPPLLDHPTLLVKDRARTSNGLIAAGLCCENSPLVNPVMIVNEVVLKQFENPDETRSFEKGKLEIVRIGGMIIGRATYEPGWKWSDHVSHLAGTPFCEVEHVGLVISGRAMAAMIDGEQVELVSGSLFYVPAKPHDSWVIGNEPYISLHFFGADQYAATAGAK